MERDAEHNFDARNHKDDNTRRGFGSPQLMAKKGGFARNGGWGREDDEGAQVDFDLDGLKEDYDAQPSRSPPKASLFDFLEKEDGRPFVPVIVRTERMAIAMYGK